ncbi:MAG: hypothetical protein QM765_49515 [Myxococcales bacterium]
MLLDKIVGNLGGMMGIGGGDEGKAQGSQGAKSNSFQQIGDSFKNGDMMGGIGQILGMVTGMGNMGGSMTEMMNPMMFVDPLSKKIFEECSKLGYSDSTQQSSTAAPATSKSPTYDEKWTSALNTVNKYYDLLDTAAGVGGKDGLIGRCDLEAALQNPSLPAELKQACAFMLANPAAFNQLEVSAGIGKVDGLIGKCDIEAALKVGANSGKPVGGSPSSASPGSVNDGQPVTGQPASNQPRTYDEKWASALDNVNKYYDLLDTAAGVGGKDGLIGRCDLEAALRNPSLPAELKQACAFLLANPAAFNQLEVSAGIGKVDGLIGKCDVEAALKALPKKTEPAKANGTDPKNGASTTGTGGSAKTGTSGSTTPTTTTTTTAPKDEAKTTSTEATQAKVAVDAHYQDMSIEEILWEIMGDINGDINEVANKMKNVAKDSEDFAKLQQKLQTLSDRRKQMYTLISNIEANEHAMSMTAINNIR